MHRFAVILVTAFFFTVGCNRKEAGQAPSEGDAGGTVQPVATPVSDPPGRQTNEAVPPKPTSRSASGENVLLITIDTTRADRLGCYGYANGKTPAIDELAAHGTLFEQAYTQVPITLPAHCSIMTGRYPREHGISDNAAAKLAASHPTLAKLAKDKGYRTGAFVASYILDSRFGLDAGFDTYNDDMGTRDRNTDPTHWEQPANVVTDRALEWLKSNSDGNFFAWIHYYDAHDPYAPPAEFAQIGSGPYDGEVAFMDTQIGRLTRWLTDEGLNERTLVVLVGDHGESFGEHGEHGHTIFLYETNLHVPLVFSHPHLVKPGRRVPNIVEVVDVLPTIVGLLGWAPVEGLGSRSLAEALRGGETDDRPAYSESLYALHTYGLAEQRSLITTRWKYISSAEPELYDLRSDRDEKVNLIRVEKQVASEMLDGLRARYSAMMPGKAEALPFDVKSRQGLAALGYVDTSDAFPEEFLTPKLLDPKDHLVIMDQLKVARRMMADDRDELALPLLIGAGEKLPKSMAVQSTLGSCYLRVYDKQEQKIPGSGKEALLTRALKALNATIQLDPTNQMALVSLGDVLVRLHRANEAVQHYLTVLNTDDSHAEVHLKLGEAYREAGRLDEAIRSYRKAIELDPTLAKAYYDLGVIYADRDQLDEALRHYHEAARHNPHDPITRYNLGITLYRLEQYPDAIVEFQEALRLKENYGDAMINLGVAMLKHNQIGEGQAMLFKATSVPGSEAEAFFNLGVALAQQGALNQAIRFYENAVSMKPTYAPPIEELTRLYLASGRAAEAVRILRIGAKSAPREVRFSNMLAKVLATSRDDAVRNGAEAVGYAEQASKLTADRHPGVLQTLAAARAEVGDFAKAKEVATRALSLAKTSGNAELVRDLETQIQGFEEGRPVRAPNF